jgi:predicted ATPase/class 3 adenylate cyclase
VVETENARRTLPTGTVTFLRTDVEGSMGLVRELGSAWDAVNEAHMELIRAAVGDHGGIAVRTEGDALFAVFPEARAAVAAAIAAQQAVASHPWPEGAGIRVRIGLHSGEAYLAGDDYGGFEVNRAARVAAAGHGGQILLSDPTRALVADALPDGVSIRDLGAHVLRDVPHPERLYQLDVPGLPTEFPALRTAAPAAGDLPRRLTSFIGREADVAAVGDLLAENRLVTITGPGGIGKTSLGVEVARTVADRFPDGAWFVALADLEDATTVRSVIARTIGLYDGPGRPAAEALSPYLKDRSVLLVLDNFEHVLGAAQLVADLLATTTDLTVLVTSRESLRLRAERLFRLDPLGLPPVDTNGARVGVEQAPAVALFLAVARARDAGFALSEENAPAVARVCRRLDGLPLAIELAAARIGLLTVPELAARLGEGLDALGSGTRDAPARQRTLTATLEWSHGLLTPDERAALAGLALFGGGCTLDAAQAVTGASLDVLEALVAKNLVVRRAVPNESSRLMLLETVADFARDRLAERPDEVEMRRRHCDHFLVLAERAAPELERSDSPALIAELDREVHNMRAALAWTIDRRFAR